MAARWRQRARGCSKSGITNVQLVQGDVQTLDGLDDGFDAVVGRLI